MKALIVVDIQNDFCPGGSLAVSDGDKIIEPVNGLIKWFEAEDMPVVYTRDWHPSNHTSFKDYGGIWPQHCIAGSFGAEFYKDLYFPSVAILISKANTSEKEAYSGFQGTGLASTLHDMGVDHIVVVGLATDYCVKNTVLDAITLGFNVEVVIDCIKAVNLVIGDDLKAMEDMQHHGAEMLKLSDIMQE